MGSNQSVGCQEIEVFIDHPYFTNAKVLTQNSVSKLVTTFPIEENLFRSWQQQLMSHKVQSQFAFLPQKSQFSQERFCSVRGNAHIVYDNFPYLLKNQINDRAGKKEVFTQEQLWYLLLTIFSVKRQFLTLKINEGNLGNISPQNIFLSEKGEIKVGNYLSWPGNNQKNKHVMLSNSRQFIAPQDFIQLQMGVSYCKVTEASQMFAIGMTVLSAVVLKDISDIYSIDGKKFNFNQALIRIQRMRDLSNYSDTLKAVVELMCAFDVMDRLKMQDIGQILFRCESSIRLRKKFMAYPFGEKIEKKIKQYKSVQNAPYNTATLSMLSSFGPNELSPQSPQNSKLAQLKRNSMNLTQVIMGPQTNIHQKKSSNPTQSLMSSEQFITFKKTQSDSKQEKQKPLQRYQQINANFGSNSLTDMDYLHLINMSKQVIIQKPVVIDGKRRSDDIEEEVTPVETPLETPNQSSAGERNQGFGRQFQVPKEYSKESVNFNFVQKNPLSKTTNVGFRPHFSTQSTFKVKSAHSQDPWVNQSAKRQDIIKTQNSTVTIYIPMNDSLDQSTTSLWQSQKSPIDKKVDRKILQTGLPSLIQQYSKQQSSQFLASRLSQKDKQQLESRILGKLQQLNVQNKKTVKFAQEQNLTDLSHQSKILSIDDVEMDCMENQLNKIKVGYKQTKRNSVLVEVVNVDKKHSFVHIREDHD